MEIMAEKQHHYERCLQIIESCRTEHQMESALNLIRNFYLSHHDRSLFDSLLSMHNLKLEKTTPFYSERRRLH